MQVGIHERVSLLFCYDDRTNWAYLAYGSNKPNTIFFLLSLCILHRESNGLKTFCSMIR